jgi:hypothetical protein
MNEKVFPWIWTHSIELNPSMTDSRFLPSSSLPSDSISIVISHKKAPIYYLLDRLLSIDDETNETYRTVIHCQISSNLFFYTTLLGELSSSAIFAQHFHQLVARNMSNCSSFDTRFRPIFSHVAHRNQSLRLKVNRCLQQYDEWINRRW